jgi:putative endonuclease
MPAFAGMTMGLGRVKGGWVYIMTNKPFGTLYIGVTSDLPARAWQHRNGLGSSFCKRHGLTMLVYAEHHDRIDDAIAREKSMKAWKHSWKLRQIVQMNPSWDDFYETLNH